MNHRWQILLTSNGVYGKWGGRYRSADEALAAVNALLEREQ